MSLFGKKEKKTVPDISPESTDLQKLLKEREKQEEEFEAKWKNTMLDEAYKIDTMEYEKMVRELKEHLSSSAKE